LPTNTQLQAWIAVGAKAKNASAAITVRLRAGMLHLPELEAIVFDSDGRTDKIGFATEADSVSY
jgi:hypothetical protein